MKSSTRQTKSFLLKAYGYEKPLPLQEEIIPPFLKGKNLIVEAPFDPITLTSFAIAILQAIDEKSHDIQALILTPTREMAIGVTHVFKAIGELLKITVLTCVGGTDATKIVKQFKEGGQIVVGTPGRVYDMQRKGYFRVDNLKFIVVEEADEIISKGFDNLLRDIFEIIPSEAQVERNNIKKGKIKSRIFC